MLVLIATGGIKMDYTSGRENSLEEEEETIYSRKKRETLVEEGALRYEEDGFMEGYEEELEFTEEEGFLEAYEEELFM